jgi:hypothetical protein
MLEIAAMTANQIIDHPNRKARRQQCIDHMAADESSAPRNHRNGLAVHAALSFFNRRTL